MSLCPRGCGRPSRRLIWNRPGCPALCLACYRGHAWDGRGRYLTADRGEATKRGNATRKRQQAARIEARYAAALKVQRQQRKVAA